MRRIHKRRKFLCPNVPSAVLHREPLVKMLVDGIDLAIESDHIYKLVLLCAPAGYGKTTLLAEVAQRTQATCCWYMLDRADSDNATFLEMLIACIRHQFPEFGQEFDGIVESIRTSSLTGPASLHYFEELMEMVAATVDEEIEERCALLLCNYHEIASTSDVHHLINHLINYLPPHCAIVLESRAIPTIDLALLVARRQLLAVGKDQLRFSTQDMQALTTLQGRKALPEEEMQALVEMFDGWVTGLLLGTYQGGVPFASHAHCSQMSIGSSTMYVNRQALFAYMVHEVFKNERHLYHFLQENSVLEQMIPEWCNHLLSTSDAVTQLDYIEQQGLFVTRHGNGGEMFYTCYPILRDMLYEELQQKRPERFAELHRRASEILSEAQEYEKAIVHALIAGEEMFAAEIINEMVRPMLVKGYSEKITQWIDSLSFGVLARFPQILISRANVHLNHAETEQAIRLLDYAQAALDNPEATFEADLTPFIQAQILLHRSGAACNQGNYYQAQQLCKQCFPLLTADDKLLRGLAYSRLGQCASALGENQTAITCLQQALQIAGTDTKSRQAARFHNQLAVTYNVMGNYVLAEHHRSRAIHYYEHVHDKIGEVNSVIGMGYTKCCMGHFQEAEVFLVKALQLARKMGLRNCESYALLNLGEMYQGQNLYTQALPMFEDALALAKNVQDTYLTNSILCFLSLNYLLMNDIATAQLFMKQVELQKSGSRGYAVTFYTLICGTILLMQGEYQQACEHLSTVVSVSEATDDKLSLIPALLRLAVCQWKQENLVEMHRLIEKAVAIVVQESYAHIASHEIERFPVLRQVLQITPYTPCVETWFHLAARSENSLPQDIPEVSPIVVQKDASVVSIQALGEPAVIINGVPVTRWRMARSMELYFYLLDCQRPIRKEQIIDTLWPEVDDNIDQKLRSTVFYLRKAVGENSIISQAGTYSLDLTAQSHKQIYYDVSMFEQQYRIALKAREADTEDAMSEALKKMIELYQGDYVQSFYSNWCVARRDELRRYYLDARHQLAQIAWRREKFDESIVHWQHILAVDNCAEEAHHGVMRCYLRQGKRNLAVRQYQRCVEVLQEELAVEPGSFIQRLYQRIVTNSTT